MQMKKDSDFLKRREEVAAYNKKHKWVKRGISMTHCRSAVLHQVYPHPAIGLRSSPHFLSSLHHGN